MLIPYYHRFSDEKSKSKIHCTALSGWHIIYITKEYSNYVMYERFIIREAN